MSNLRPIQTAAIEDQVRRELIQQLYRNERLVTIALPLMLLVVLFTLWGEVDSQLLVTWVVVCLVIDLLLILLIRTFHRADTEQQASTHWIHRLMMVAFIEEFAWGLLFPLSYQAENPLYHSFVLILLAGSTAGGISTRGIHHPHFIASSLPMMVIVLLTLLLHPNEISLPMLILVFIFFGYLHVVAQKYSLQYRNNLSLWLTNKQLVGELSQSKMELEQASEAKSRFLAHMSHELRTPLNGVIGFASAMSSTSLNRDQSEYLDNISRSADTLLHMVNEVLDLTSIESGRLALVEEAFSLNEEIAALVASLSIQAEKKDLKLSYDIDPKLPNRLQGDIYRIRQAISNLVVNAIKYTDWGTVTLHLWQPGDNPGRLRVEVRDTGHGISEEVKESLFEPFTQGEEFAEKRHQGVGLGLSITKRLIEAMQGEVDIDTSVYEGSLVWFEIPLNVAEEQTVRADTENRSEPKEVTADRFALEKVLIVDDNDINRKVLKILLQNLGIEHSEASGGVEALKKLRSKDYTLAFMDIQMPDLSGIEVLQLCDEYCDSPPAFVAVTAHAYEHEIEKIVGQGFKECLIKPITMEKLYDSLSRWGGSQPG